MPSRNWCPVTLPKMLIAFQIQANGGCATQCFGYRIETYNVVCGHFDRMVSGSHPLPSICDPLQAIFFCYVSRNLDSGEGLAARVSAPGPLLPGHHIVVTAVTPAVNNPVPVPADVYNDMGPVATYFFVGTTSVNTYNPVPEVFNNHSLLQKIAEFLPDPDPPNIVVRCSPRLEQPLGPPVGYRTICAARKIFQYPPPPSAQAKQHDKRAKQGTSSGSYV